MTNGDLPAMPITSEPYPVGAIPKNSCEGLTKREELSARFMAAIISNPTTRTTLTDLEVAMVACEQADALLRAWGINK
jgi:hypothetical protein